MAYPIKSPRKLIEVALPLDAINLAAAKEKGNPFLKGHPRNLHQWWARRPMAVARAVIFAQLVNDPGYQQGGGFKYGKNKKEAAEERKRLFKIIEDLVLWDNTRNETVLGRARAEIQRSWREICELNKEHPEAAELFNPDKPPGLHDPFAGGGAIPLEAQRLGIEAFASDLNPVAVLINKAMIEIPPKFAGRPPVCLARKRKSADGYLGLDVDQTWPGATGLAEDVRYYGNWMREEAQKRIGHLYPPVEITKQMTKERPDLTPLVGQKLTVIACLWARTVKSPNPAFRYVDVPLASTFILSSKEGKEAYVEILVEADRYRFQVKLGKPPAEAKNGTKLTRGANFRCVVSGTSIEPDYIKEEGKAGRMGTRLMVIVAEGKRGKLFLAPTQEHEAIALQAQPDWKPEFEISGTTQYLGVKPYGMNLFSQLFTDRQIVALTTFSNLVGEISEKVRLDALEAGMQGDEKGLATGGNGALAYAEAVALFEALAIDKLADYNNMICTWNPTNQNVSHLFTKQAIPMSWDFCEASPIQGGLSFDALTEGLSRTVEMLPASSLSTAFMHDCSTDLQTEALRIISTDPPYYDNVPYSDLSDFFYVWLRHSLRPILPEIFATMTTPKTTELVAFAYRHNGKIGAEAFFLKGMTQAMKRLAANAHKAFPVTIYYAFKQSETDDTDGTASTGWETFLEAVIRAGFNIGGTWPVRTERAARARGIDSNALASSIVLVCRARSGDATTTSRREFLRELNGVLPEALDEMTRGAGGEHSPVAPVDLSQAIIGPGMAVFSKYAAVLEADGSPMSVRTALQLINRFLAEDDFDADTQFCLHWFEQHGWSEGLFGTADTLSRGKGTSVNAMQEAGVLHSGGGKVRLLKWAEYPSDWDPRKDARTPIWEALHQLIRALKQGGESASGALLAALGGKAESARQLAYRLYTLCERLGQAEDARAYNELITSWTGIEAVANTVPKPVDQQGLLFED